MMVPDWAGYLLFREAFAGVMDPRRHTLGWLDRRILDGTALFWRTDKAAIVAEVIEYPTGARDVHGLIAAGALEDIIETLIPTAEAWGRENGCIGAIIASRAGWLRALAAKGYELHQVELRKGL